MDRDERLVLAATKYWLSTVFHVGRRFATRTEDGLQVPVALGRNTVRHLFGHLIVVHDIMGQFTGLGPRRFELETGPDR